MKSFFLAFLMTVSIAGAQSLPANTTATQFDPAGAAATAVAGIRPISLGLIPGPIAGTSTWYTAAENGGGSITAVQATVTAIFPVNANTLQIAFGNAWGVQEGTCGPNMTLQVSLLLANATTTTPLTFDGSQTATLAPCGFILSDPIAVDQLSANAMQIRYLAQKVNLADTTTSFPAAWTFGSPNTLELSNIGANNTVLGTYVDYGEEYKARLLAGCTRNSTSTITCTDGAFSSSGTGTSGDINSTITIAGTVYTISSVTSTTAVVVTPTPSVTDGSAMAATILPPNKVALTSVMGRGNNVQLFSPMAVLGYQAVGTATNNACGVGDSIMWGTGLSAYEQGSWFTQGLNQAGVGNLQPTRIANAIPFLNMSQPSETVAGFVASHNIRFQMLARCQKILGALAINDLRLNNSAASVVEPLLIQLWQQERARGPKIYQGTLMPLSTSTDSWLTLANQATTSHETDRVTLNTWFRTGACLTPSVVTNTNTGLQSFAYVYAASASTTTLCAAYYNGATSTAASVGSAVPSITANGVTTYPSHPLTGTVEIANAVESAQNSGLWAVAGAQSGTYAGDLPATLYTCTSPVSASPVTVTCPSASFTSAVTGTPAYMYGSGMASGTQTATYVSATSITINAATTTAVSSGSNTLIVDGGKCGPAVATSACGGARNAKDGIHPFDWGHRLTGILFGQTVSVW